MRDDTHRRAVHRETHEDAAATCKYTRRHTHTDTRTSRENSGAHCHKFTSRRVCNSRLKQVNTRKEREAKARLIDTREQNIIMIEKRPTGTGVRPKRMCKEPPCTHTHSIHHLSLAVGEVLCMNDRICSDYAHIHTEIDREIG